MTITWREQFSLPRDIAYFDTAAVGLAPRSLQPAFAQAFDLLSMPWQDAKAVAAEKAQNIRGQVADLMGVAADDVAMVRSVGAGIATALGALDLAAGQRILRVAGEHPSVSLQTERFAAMSGAEEDIVPDPDGGDWTDAIVARINADREKPVTAAVLAPAHWTDGRFIDLETIAHILRQQPSTNDAALIIDATHAAGVMTLPLHAIRADFIAFPGFKWLLGPVGLAYLVAAPHRQNGEPLDRNGYNSKVDTNGKLAAFHPQAGRYDMGERNALESLLHAEAGLAALAAVDHLDLSKHLHALADETTALARSYGFTVTGGSRNAPHLLGLSNPDGLGADAETRLRAHGIIVSTRGNGLRVSLYLHNDSDDVSRLHAALSKLEA